MNVIQQIVKFLEGKKVLILGFGREGKSTYKFIKKYIPDLELGISDFNEVDIDEKIYCGSDYLDAINFYDIVIKSPGIAFKDLDLEKFNGIVTSQTVLLLKYNRNNIIGITGTKGKTPTPTGVFKVRSKLRNINLVGPSWNSHVKYWMAFKGSSYGLHDASWRSSKQFSNHRTYLKNGSHGCINLRPGFAPKLYNAVKKGTTVIVQK
jgi:hypothetical protein